MHVLERFRAADLHQESFSVMSIWLAYSAHNDEGRAGQSGKEP
jgi:hypothetical protein